MADTSEIIGVVDVQAAPGRADAVIEAFAACTHATHAEDGCIAYALHRDNADSEHFMLVERWRSQADVDAPPERAAHRGAARLRGCSREPRPAADAVLRLGSRTR